MELLPDEILLAISRRLADNCHLQELSRVSRRLRHIAQETLVSHARIPRKGIGKFVQLLCRRPDLAIKVKTVDLGKYQDFTSSRINVDFNLEQIIGIAQPGLLQKCRTLVDLTVGEGHWARIIAASGDNDGFWNVENRLYFNILVSLSPNLRNIYLELPRRLIRELFSQEEPRYHCPFPPLAVELLQSKLRSLTVRPQPTWTPLSMKNLEFFGLCNLVRLSVPMLALINPHGEVSALGDVMPPSLEWLELSGCTKLVQKWTGALLQTRRDNGLGRLRNVDLSFDVCIREALLLIDQGCGLLSTLCTDVSQLVTMGLRIGYLDTAHTRPSADLSTELNAWSHLWDMEAWYAAMKGNNFSAIVALTENGEPRRRSRTELRSFLRQDMVSKPRHVSFRFAPKLPLLSTPKLAFGTKKSDNKSDFKCVPNAETWKQIHAHYKVPASAAPTYEMTSMMPYSSSVPGSPSSDFFSNKEPAEVEPTVSMGKFNGEEWAGVAFFSDLKASPTPRSESQKRHFKERSATKSMSTQASRQRRKTE